MDGSPMGERRGSGERYGGERFVLRALLTQPGFRYLRLPDELERGYHVHHHELALRNLRAFWPLVVLALLVIAALTFASGFVHEVDRERVLVGYGALFVAVSIVVVSVLVRPLNAYIERTVAVAAFVGLLAMHAATLVTSASPALRSMAEDWVIFVTVGTFTISNLTFHSAISACVASMVGLSVLCAASGLSPDWTHFPYYGIASALFGSIVGVTHEIRERTVYLQERLLAVEKRELDLLTQELAAISREDALTGLPNRRHFDEVLAREWSACLRESAMLSLFFIDVDYFKRFNDRYGHRAGDECLARIGRALAEQALRGADFVARYGGEEFVALFPRTDPDGARSLAARMIAAVDALRIPHAGSEAAPHVTISVGVASVVPTGDNGPEGLMTDADAALYRAKESGRHRSVSASD